MPEIIIDVPLDYENEKTTIIVNGVKGPACKELTRQIEMALGKVEKTMPTHEMTAPPEKAKVHARK